MQEIAFAKINLALHVRARRPDGYHEIETVFAFAEDGDVLAADDHEALTLEIGGPFAGALAAAQRENLVLRAASALRDRYEVQRGVRLKLQKRLPVAAGLGGGSADAAAALRLLARWWQVKCQGAELLAIAAALGADVPACLSSRPARGEGRGDTLRFIAEDGIAGTPVLLVNPGVPLSTAAVFAGWDGVDRGPLGDWREGRNDLQPAAIGLVPEIRAVLEALQGGRFVRMSGSGATCFGLYASETERDRAAARIRAAYPDWWMLATRLR